MKNFDEVKADIEPVVKQNKAAHAVEVLANTVLSQAKTDGLEKAAAAKGLQVINTDFVCRTELCRVSATLPQLMDAVFNAKEKAAPDESQIPQGYAIFQVQAVKPPATPSFEEIRSRVETEFKNERAGLLLQQKTQELSDRAKAEHDLKKAAKELGATVKTSELVLPDGQVPDIGSHDRASLRRIHHEARRDQWPDRERKQRRCPQPDGKAAAHRPGFRRQKR